MVDAECSFILEELPGNRRRVMRSDGTEGRIDRSGGSDLGEVETDTSFVVTGFRRRWGIRMNCFPRPPTVSVAISLGVRTAVPTEGFVASFIREKSPPRSVGCGRVVDDALDG